MLFNSLLFKKNGRKEKILTIIKWNQFLQRKLAVIIPARDEALNIVRCIQSVLQQNYPEHLLEIILIDDHSEDETASLVEQLYTSNVRVIRMAEQDLNSKEQAYKKKRD